MNMENNGCRQNLEKQIDSIFKDCHEGSIKTRYRYKEATERFCDFLANEYKIQKFDNVKSKHISSYVEHLKKEGASPATIKTDLSGIRYFHKHSNSKNVLIDNNKLNIDRRSFAVIDRSWLPQEIESAKAYAKEVGRIDVYISINLSSSFGLRLEEVCKVTPLHIKQALQSGELWTKGKNGQERYIKIRTEAQQQVLLETLSYAKEHHLKSSDMIVLGGNIKGGVQREKRSIQSFIFNHKSEFIDNSRLYAPDTNKQRRMTLNFHGLRYTYANNLYNAIQAETKDTHFSRRYVSEQLGHHREDVTRVYLK